MRNRPLPNQTNDHQQQDNGALLLKQSAKIASKGVVGISCVAAGKAAFDGAFAQQSLQILPVYSMSFIIPGQ